MNYKALLNKEIKFSSKYNLLQTKGNLAYEYNPFRNYRLTDYAFEYQNYIYSLKELKNDFNIVLTRKVQQGENKYNFIEIEKEDEITSSDLINNNLFFFKKAEEYNEDNKLNDVIIRRKGELVDFVTSEFNFSIEHPVEILSQSSYDGSVNLILNDGINQPRLINSRFSPLGKNKYQIVDRKGDNDTNIYDQGEQFDIDTSLYKRTNYIPKLIYYGTFLSGDLPIGNYHFYFKYMDADGNETDFIAESGLISVFIGNEPQNIYSGFRQESSYKGVSLLLTNLDISYQYISVYFTRATSDIRENKVTSAYKINQKYIINSANSCSIKVTGYETIDEITNEEINPIYQVVDSAETQTTCNNRLFLGNISKPDINYKELTDISLRFVPEVITEDYDISKKVNAEYQPQSEYNNSYYNSKFIYDKVGYWPGEMYRFGIVYILSNHTLSPVFNVRGADLFDKTNEYYNPGFGTEDNREYISYHEDTNLIIATNANSKHLENVKGVVRIKDDSEATNYQIYSIKFKLQHSEECIKQLKKLSIKGFFFVRQRRIPTTLCEAFMIGVDKNSHTPVIPYNGKYISESFLCQDPIKETISAFGIKVKENGERRYLLQDYTRRLIETNSTDIDSAALCPEYDVNSPYLNSLFNGDSFTIQHNVVQPDKLSRLYYEDRYYYTNSFKKKTKSSEKTNIIGVEDNVKLVAIDNTYYSARAGEAEEAFRYKYIKYENIIKDATNLIRGSFGPYIGIKKCNDKDNPIISIKIPDYNENNISDYFQIRYNSQSPYFAISDRLEIGELSDIENKQFYRGDSYICQVTHRINRNFQDPSAPTNDVIVDKKCWYENYDVQDGVVKTENFNKINLGDVNAIQLGQWVTFTIRCNMNLSVRTIDESIPDEIALTGHPRSFFPNCPMSAAGPYKIPEALCYNKGFENSLSERFNFETPDVPTIKNDFTNRIIYSDINVNDAFKNGYRVFQGKNYRDYPKTYGQITKLLTLGDYIICVFEHGITLIPVNERTLTGQGAGGSVYISANNVLPQEGKTLSDMYGSQWKDSIIKTRSGIYGVDTVSKVIWKVTFDDAADVSQFNVKSFLIDNITLSEREITPIIGIRNVKTHYNKNKGDIMFTFYDDLYGFEEKAWNLCYNELTSKWVTFYSWIPSYSENIYNQLFTFDRNTSKWIAKLGISKQSSDFADGIVLDENVFNNDLKEKQKIGKLSIANRNLPNNCKITYQLERDNFRNDTLFDIHQDEDKEYCLYLNKGVNAIDLCSELYQRKIKQDDSDYIINDLTEDKNQFNLWKQAVLNNNLELVKDENGINVELDNKLNSNKLVYLINVSAKVEAVYNVTNETLKEAYENNFNNYMTTNESYYKSTIAIIPKYNMQFLTTNFWKHGHTGIIDEQDEIEPTKWYDKQHPFEIEFYINDDSSVHKIFDSLQILSNNSEPESFHYEIIGDCFDFKDDKKNMYIRQEATKELYQYNGSDILYDKDYIKLKEKHRMIYDGTNKIDLYDKSTLFPLYYSRQDSINEIEDYYHAKDDINTKNFSNLAGAEIVRYKKLDEYRIWNHAQAVDLTKTNRLRGNMHYREDKWYVQINPINFVQKNETDSRSGLKNADWENELVPIEIGQNPLAGSALNNYEKPDDLKDRNVITWNWEESQNKEVKIKDKWLKVRIRYSGKKLTTIHAIIALYSISYS